MPKRAEMAYLLHMAKLTITEALAEVKTIKARVEKKHANVLRYFGRHSNVKDPLEKDGGSVAFIKAERQGIEDLLARWVRIRTAIQQANVSTKATVAGLERSVADWLNWRREIAPVQKAHVASFINGIQNARNEAKKQGVAMVEKETGQAPEIVICINEQEVAVLSESLETTLGELDGKLSLINATTVIDVE